MELSRTLDDITSNLSVLIKRIYCVSHDSSWSETRTKLDYTLWNIMDGTITLKNSDGEFKLSSGDVVFFCPGNAYSASAGNDGCKFLYIRFSVKMGTDIDLLSPLGLSGILPSESIGGICGDFCKKYSALYSSSQKLSFGLYADFLKYLNDVLNLSAKIEHIRFSGVSARPAPADPNILRAMEYIEENFQKNIVVRELAKSVYMSEKYFISCFKNTTGISPGQYLIQCRMKKAVWLLLNTDLQISEIAKEVGYSNPYNFSNTFKKYYEVSPVNYKKNFIY